MNRLKKIYIIGPNHNAFFLNIFLWFRKSNQNIIDTSFPQPNGINLKSYTKFSWNNFGTKIKLEIQSLAFKLYDDINLENNSRLISDLLFPNSKDLSLFQDFENKLNIESISYILLSLGILKINEENNCILIFPKKYKKIFYQVIKILNKKKTEIPNNLLNINPKNVKFIGFLSFDLFKDYFMSLGVVLYFLSTIRFIGKYKKKFFKLGLLTWANALEISNNNESSGLDSVIPNSLFKEEILIYSKTYLRKKYFEKLKSQKYRITIFDKKEIFKKSSLKDFIKLIKLLGVIFFKFLFLSFSIEPNIRSNIPRLIFEILKWEKFLEMFYFNISISYNDYAISDLIRNKLFSEKKIDCWSYVHSATEYHLYSKDKLFPDPKKSFISYNRRYYLLPQQINYFNACRVKSNINDIIGPLFKTYKNCYKVNNNLETKIIISVFLCSMGEKVLHPVNSHITFLNDLINLLKELGNDYLFLFKGKSKCKEIIESSIGSVDFFNLINNGQVYFVDENVPSSKLINVSQGVISMAFTSPSIEALAANKPAVFYDPIGIMKNNYLEKFSSLYITDNNSLKDFISKISNVREINSWVEKKKKEIGISDTNIGVKKIQQDIELYFKK